MKKPIKPRKIYSLEEVLYSFYDNLSPRERFDLSVYLIVTILNNGALIKELQANFSMAKATFINSLMVQGKCSRTAEMKNNPKETLRLLLKVCYTEGVVSLADLNDIVSKVK